MDNIKQRVVIRKEDRGEYILGGLCDFWGCDIDYLRSRAINNKRLKEQKQIAIYLLYDVADFRLKDICNVMGYAPKTVHTLTAQREDIAQLLNPKWGDSRLIKEYKAILTHLNLN